MTDDATDSRYEVVLLGVSEVAARAGLSRQAVSNAYRRGTMPPPVTRLSTGPVWFESQINEWIRGRETR